MTLQPGDPMPGGHGSMRSSTADRERAIDVLKAAFAEGRLSREEFEQRAGQAYRSRTYAELGALTADLPAGPLGAVAPPPVPYPVAQYPAVVQYPPVVPRRTVNSLAVAALVCSLIPGFPAVAAVIAGVAARQQIRQRGERGQGIATAAIVIGTISLVAFLLWQIGIAGFS
jgi:hypothetical protein